jgi:integrase
MPRALQSFRVGKVQAYLRNRVWYLCYHEHGKRRRPRVGPDREAAKQLAAQINAQLAVGAPAAMSFEPISISDLRQCWLDHHEHTLRSSVHTIRRYRAATDHLIRFLACRPVRHVSHFQVNHAEAFVQHLRSVEISPNGHKNTAVRTLLDKGVQYILECCRTLFAFAAKRRHLPPYADNPFATLEIDRIPIERFRAIELFSADQERAFVEACDDFQLPLFLTLMLTGIRPGEACHLLLPDDLDLEARILRIRNKPELGWQVKTRNERDVPLLPVLALVLKRYLGDRIHGPVFRRPMWEDTRCTFNARSVTGIRQELAKRIEAYLGASGGSVSRSDRLRLARTVWWDIGALKEDRIRTEFMRLTKLIGLQQCTAPKMLRHLFATALQEGRVDPLIRNLLMGHATSGQRSAGHGLGMTAVYTHSRPETMRQQLEEAFVTRPAVLAANRRLHLDAEVLPKERD